MTLGPDLIMPGMATPKLTAEVRVSDMMRFSDKIESDGLCWKWKGFKDRKGYGKFWFRGRSWWAHRWSYAFYVGEIPEGETVDHACRNPSCVRPSHLKVMSRVENTIKGNEDRTKDMEVPF